MAICNYCQIDACPQCDTIVFMKQTLSSLPSKAAFFFGFMLATGIILIIGCIGLLSILLSGKLPTEIGNPSSNTNSGPVNVTEKTSVDLSSLRNVKGRGDITVIEYTDLECPFCKKFHPLLESVMKDYDTKVRFAVKHFPLNIHPKARKEALAAECAGQQKQFFEFVDAIFTTTTSNNTLEESVLFETARQLGLNEDQFKTCVEKESFAQEVSDDALEAQATGATGTPHTLIVGKDGKIITGIRGSVSESQLRKAIDDALAQ